MISGTTGVLLLLNRGVVSFLLVNKLGYQPVQSKFASVGHLRDCRLLKAVFEILDSH
jgi:hypothetical protein